MAKLSLSPMTSGFLTATLIDANSDSIESEFQRKVLYRDNPTGEPNEMNNDIDMNGYNLLNLGNISIMASASLSQAIICDSSNMTKGILLNSNANSFICFTKVCIVARTIGLFHSLRPIPTIPHSTPSIFSYSSLV